MYTKFVLLEYYNILFLAIMKSPRFGNPNTNENKGIASPVRYRSCP
ncbi:hypothetical protein CJ739_1296 [Mariniflexile rhizosphaerae]|nr:hypothetical protein [Mariniflexile sp. TRM1-10]AXP80387.1 hypothetical protein CJ739_1296 [Mariniflexile sp. TRM1-10]PLB20594.1 MAG: hypothetical protein TRG1_576 [Flavobacteriaceae bacterium FS1-H7996/R]